mmetsp:Transcript_4798/g.16016  ORF Transcript_4798/g.16016 Transcript_4798/m.16016 type:complete len:241 (+) Transcript_4798:672-1394(+)
MYPSSSDELPCDSTSLATSNSARLTWYRRIPPMPPKPCTNCEPSSDRSVTNSRLHPKLLYSFASHSSMLPLSIDSNSAPVSWSLKFFWSFSCSGVRCTMCVSPVVALESTCLLTSMFSQIISVSTAPISRHISVSLTPKQYLPLSCAISSKNFPISFFSLTNLTLPRVSALSSIACENPFSPPYETSTIIRIIGVNRMSKRSLCMSWFLKSALPAITSPLTFGLSCVMKCAVVSSAIFRT